MSRDVNGANSPRPSPHASGSVTALVLIIAAAFAARAWGAAERPLWWDDLHTLHIAKKSWSDIIASTCGTQFKPLGYIAQHMAMRYRESVFLMRLPTILFSTATVWGLASVARAMSRESRLASPVVALIAALNVAQIMYANEIRFYALQSALIVWGFAYFLRAMDARSVLTCGISGALHGLSLLTAQFSFFWFAAQILVFIPWLLEGKRMKLFAAWIIPAAPCVAYFVVDQFRLLRALGEMPRLGEVFPPLTPRNLAGWVKFSIFGNGYPSSGVVTAVIVAAVVVLFAALLARLADRSLVNRRIFSLALMTVFPFLGFVVLQALFSNLYQHRYLLPSSSLLLVGIAVTLAPSRRLAAAAALLLVLHAGIVLRIFYASPTAYGIMKLDERTMQADFYMPDDADALASAISAFRPSVIIFDRIEPFLYWYVYGAGAAPRLIAPSSSPHVWSYSRSVEPECFISGFEDYEADSRVVAVLHDDYADTRLRPSGAEWKGMRIVALDKEPHQ